MKLWKLKKSTYGLDNRFDRASKKNQKSKGCLEKISRMKHGEQKNKARQEETGTTGDTVRR